MLGITRSSRRALSTTLHKLRANVQSHVDLEQIDTLLFRASRSNLWVPPAAKAVFGGQVLGQALHAATRTLGAGALGPHKSISPVSLHSYFLLRGDPTADILYSVRETSDLRSFSSRTVDAIQRGRTIFKMQAQFSRSTDGLAHARTLPTDVLPPEECPSQKDALRKLLDHAPTAYIRSAIEKMLVAPVEVRYATGQAPDFLDASPPAVPARQLLYMKLRDPINEASRLDECVAAYMSDQPLLFTALLPHGVTYPFGVSTIATLDHSMWFHAPFRADEWLLYEMTSPSASRGHALAFGHLYRIDTGQLVVSCAQQGLIRPTKPSLTSALTKAAIPLLARWLRR